MKQIDLLSNKKYNYYNFLIKNIIKCLNIIFLFSAIYQTYVFTKVYNLINMQS